LGKKGKIFENSKFRTLLISCSVTAENVHFTIATRILLCPQIFPQRARQKARAPKTARTQQKTLKNPAN
jgi:hypothetical protein